MSEENNLLEIVVQACDDRKADNIVALDMLDVTPIADVFVICQGSNERQVQAIARSVKSAAEEMGYHIERMEGFERARWVLLDMGSVVCHVFHEEERNHYQLDKLWGDAAPLNISSYLSE